jgi:S1-C subfamily serine protease
MRRGFYSAGARKTPTRPAAEPAPLPDNTKRDVAEPRSRAWRRLYTRAERPLLFAAGAALAVALVALHASFTPAAPVLTQEDIDQAVARTLETKALPSPAMKAYQAVRGSIVRVRASGPAAGDGFEHDEYLQRAIGSGVVIIDRGVILTSLHVVAGASRVRVEFEDGLETDAALISTQPDHDLAVLQARDIPDDLQAATLRSAKHLIEGEHVTAVGFPFGIGPSVSHGVISGLHRQYRSPEGDRVLSELIQFDAAANPGSSGGPLVNAEGEVVGIVTAILAPSEKAGFAGIAFAVPIEIAAGAAGLPPF